MMLLLLAVAVPACAGCHPAEAKSHASTPMMQALMPARDSAVLRDNPELRTRRGVYEWKLRSSGGDPVYSVSDGKQTVTAKLRWAFGFGVLGQTFVYEKDGALYESTMSYYAATKGLDYTPGHVDRPQRNIEEAAGRLIDPAEVRRCFGCHSTGSAEPVNTGVQCSHCHADTAQHAVSLSKVTKLRQSSSEEISGLCGACHRTWEDIATNGPKDINNVRFQPYRLANSKCYDAEDRRISCTACHEPHTPASHVTAGYDAKCLACHTQGNQAQGNRAQGNVCKVGKRDCVTCHMPKTAIPGIHFGFTDHWIRVVRPGETYPQ